MSFLPRHLAAALLLAAFAPLLPVPAESAAPRAVPSGVSYTLIGTYDLARLNTILTTERVAFCDYPATFAPAKNAVRLYRVTYPSVVPEQANRPTAASGLLAVPDNAGSAPLPVVSYQHGTVFSKTEVPSRPDESMETRLMLAAFAAQGYVVVAADYFGKGDSPEPDSYLVRRSTQQACLDFLRAAQAVSGDLKVTWGPLFLSGWSQGGWATMTFLQRLETVGIPVKAAATASAPNDLFALINRWIHAPAAADASYVPGLIALQLNAYERYDGLPGLADAAIRPAYRDTARDLFLNKITWAVAAKKFPAHLADLLDPAFAAPGSAADGRYWEILQQSAAYRWRSVTPLRTYWGGADEVVPPFIAQLPAGYQKVIGGAAAEAVAAGEKATHRGTFVFAVADQKKWFDQLAGR